MVPLISAILELGEEAEEENDDDLADEVGHGSSADLEVCHLLLVSSRNRYESGGE